MDTDPAVDEFAQWFRGRHGAEPDREAAEALADEWMSGVIPETRRWVSPARLHHRCELIGDWIDDELTRAAIAPVPGLGEMARRTRRIRRAISHAIG